MDMKASAVLVGARNKVKKQKVKEGEIDEYGRVKYTTMLDPDLLKQLRHLAIDKEVNIKDLINEAVKIYLKSQSGS